jgi:hypothetical protein
VTFDDRLDRGVLKDTVGDAGDAGAPSKLSMFEGRLASKKSFVIARPCSGDTKPQLQITPGCTFPNNTHPNCVNLKSGDRILEKGKIWH